MVWRRDAAEHFLDAQHFVDLDMRKRSSRDDRGAIPSVSGMAGHVRRCQPAIHAMEGQWKHGGSSAGRGPWGSLKLVTKLMRLCSVLCSCWCLVSSVGCCGKTSRLVDSNLGTVRTDGQSTFPSCKKLREGAQGESEVCEAEDGVE